MKKKPIYLLCAACLAWSCTNDPTADPAKSNRAWVVDFTRGKPAVYPTKKIDDIDNTKHYKLRCVSDY